LPSIRLVAVDLDGTLLNDQKLVSPADLAALQAAAARGIFAVIASGRIFSSVLPLSRAIAAGQPYLSSNGALTGWNDREGFSRTALIGDDLVRFVLDEAAAALGPSRRLHLHLLNGAMAHLQGPGLPKSWPAGETHLALPPDALAPAARGQCLKFVIWAGERPEGLRTLRQKLEARGLSVASSWAGNIEVMASGIDKGEALTALAATLGLSMGQVMALGDNENDAGMFRAAGLPVAMGNATPEIKALARDATLDNNHGGVAAALKKHLNL
jgi:Cof subfamily protein (haloacid dehalogenase superfamily)